jgi:hypothetical protein
MQIRLSDFDISTIYAAAGPLDDDVRDAFIHMVVAELTLLNELGPGAVYRVARTAQKRFFVPPIADGLGNKFGRGKYK